MEHNREYTFANARTLNRDPAQQSMCVVSNHALILKTAKEFRKFVRDNAPPAHIEAMLCDPYRQTFTQVQLPLQRFTSKVGPVDVEAWYPSHETVEAVAGFRHNYNRMRIIAVERDGPTFMAALVEAFDIGRQRPLLPSCDIGGEVVRGSVLLVRSANVYCRQRRQEWEALLSLTLEDMEALPQMVKMLSARDLRQLEKESGTQKHCGFECYRTESLPPNMQLWAPEIPPPAASNRDAIRRCYQCGNEGMMSVCRMCGASYCDKECQRLHWPEHKRVCGSMAAV